MALLNILQFPDPRLKTVATPIEQIDDPLQLLIDDMFETMYEAQGVGLAATQVNQHKRLIVIDVSRNSTEPLTLINPQILLQEGIQNNQEGCISFPGVYARVKRAEKVEISFTDRKQQPQTLTATGLLSQCIQHEIDHLNGVTFFDHLSPLKRKMLTKKLNKLRERQL